MNTTCSNCSARKDDPQREFYPLWFKRTADNADLCPTCAGNENVQQAGLATAQRTVGKLTAVTPEYPATTL